MYVVEKTEHVGITEHFLGTQQKYYSKACHDVNCRKGHSKKRKNMLIVDTVAVDNEHNKYDLFAMMVARKYVNPLKNKSKFMNMLPVGFCTNGCSIDIDYSEKTDGNLPKGNDISRTYHFRSPGNLFSYRDDNYRLCNTIVLKADQKELLNKLAKTGMNETIEVLEKIGIDKTIFPFNKISSRVLNPRINGREVHIGNMFGFDNDVIRHIDEGIDHRSEEDTGLRCFLFSIDKFYDFDNYEISMKAKDVDCMFIYAINKNSDDGVHNEEEAVLMLKKHVRKLIGFLTGTYVHLILYNVEYCTDCHGDDPISINRPINTKLIYAKDIFATSHLDILNSLKEDRYELSEKDCEIAWRKYQYGH